MTRQPAQGLAERLGRIELFAGLEREQLDWLAERGRERQLDDGNALFRDGEPGLFFYVLLDGGLLMTKCFSGGEQVMGRYSAAGSDRDRQSDPHPDLPAAGGQFLGELPLLTGGAHLATATAIGPTTVVVYDRSTFFALLERSPQIFRVLLPVVAWQIHTHEMSAGRSVMLAGLGTLAAGLAHELNNPISAVVRSASRLRDLLGDLPTAAVTWGNLATPEEREVLTTMLARLTGGGCAVRAGGALAAAEDGDLIEDWLSEHEVDAAAEDVGLLAERGVEVEALSALAESLRSQVLAPAITQLALSLEAGTLLDDITLAAARMQDLVISTKEYTNMDRAPERDVDLTEGLEATVTMLEPQLSGVSVHREYAEMPLVPVYPSEINQVWTSLIQNAIDALQGCGDLTLSLRKEGTCAVVEIRDSGTGIAPDVLPYVFQPFFTTKDVGHATGLGLHLSRETVTVRHGGSIDVRSAPGDTRVTVRLPLDPQRSDG